LQRRLYPVWTHSDGLALQLQSECKLPETLILTEQQHQHTDIAIVGAGAAGLMAAIWAGRTNPSLNIIALDGARRLGAKILVAGGGRCNVTHDYVDESAFAGSSRNAIKKVLRRFDVPQTRAFFREIGVELKREDTGKLFPVTDQARTVLDALLRACAESGVRLMHPRRVESVQVDDPGFLISGDWGALRAHRLILATGGKSLPKSGSDGGGYKLAKALGHSITHRVFPALVPLILPRDHPLCALSGLSHLTELQIVSATGKIIFRLTDALLCTHFGISGPAPLNISRYYTAARFDDPDAALVANWLPDLAPSDVENQLLQAGRQSILRLFASAMPERLLRTLCQMANVDPTAACDQITREARKALVETLTRLRLPITGDRGFTYAEVTAGGVPLSEIRLDTMESRLCPGLYLCGELCDVDGRIGGYNFQWAWSSGYVAGISAAAQS
jgi:predicted Rossmann fold flavoprotein